MPIAVVVGSMPIAGAAVVLAGAAVVLAGAAIMGVTPIMGVTLMGHPSAAFFSSSLSPACALQFLAYTSHGAWETPRKYWKTPHE